ncbi:MAG: M15 family metallopeptidase, partial [Actinomycetota bacterium]
MAASPPPRRSQVRRRRLVVSVAGIVVLVTLLALVLPRVLGPSRAATAETTDRGVAGQTPSPDDDPSDGHAISSISAWLAWVPGGFPTGFAAGLDRLDVFSDTAIVDGDTLWLTASRDTGGNVVDRPRRPFRIPIDAFAVDPGDYAPFLPKGQGEEILTALRDGKAVLGATSAEIRGLGPGAALTFGGVSIEIGAVAPDPLVGWSEILVSPSVGARLGIEHQRYLLAHGDPLTFPSFRETIRSLLDDPRNLRLERPGGTPYVRVASGVNPPVVMKQVFGEFAAAPRAGSAAFFTTHPAWYQANIRTRTVPILGPVTCHRKLFPALVGALQELADRGLDHLIHIYSGCFAARTVGRSPTAPPSQHAYGAAIDIDAPTNAMGDSTPAMDPRVVEVFERWGFNWGGDFVITDGM